MYFLNGLVNDGYFMSAVNATSSEPQAKTSVLGHYLGLVRFSHTVFALPFALLSAILAWSEKGVFRWQELVGILLAMVLARSSAMAFNRLVDRDYDAANPRTASRHLPAGILSVGQVTSFLVFCSLGFIASTLLFLPNTWPLILSVPVLVFLLSYSYVKRFSMWCHYWLAAALMLSPIAAWLAISGTLAWPALFLSAVIFFWVGGFDILYACQDYEFDQTAGLHSLPARLGVRTALRISAASHLLMLVCLGLFWFVADFGIVFMAGMVLFAGLLAVQHFLVREDDLSRVNLAFFHTNAILSLGILALGILDLLVRRL